MAIKNPIYNDLLALLNRWQQDDRGDIGSLLALRVMQQANIDDALQPYLQRLEQQKPIWYKVLYQRFLTGKKKTAPKVREALGTGFSEQSIYNFQTEAVTLLAKWLQEDEKELRCEDAQLLQSKLPPRTYSELFGAEAVLAQLCQQMGNFDAPHTTLVAGLGGLGKTAVTDAAVRQILTTGQYNHVAWVRYEPHGASGRSRNPAAPFEQTLAQLAAEPHINASKQPPAQRNTAVMQALCCSPHLVIIDNLEALEDVASTLEQIPSYVQPSHFIVTSRTLPTMHSGSHAIPLGELNRQASIDLLRYEATTSNVAALSEQPDDVLHQIVAQVGGNPMALKLTVGMARYMPNIKSLIADLQKGLSSTTRDMYYYIFCQTWLALTPPAQIVLQGMATNVPDSASAEQIASFAGLTEGELWNVLAELTNRCLLERRDRNDTVRYGIHRLTAAFVRSDVMKME